MTNSITIKKRTINNPKPILIHVVEDENCNSFILSVAMDLLGLPLKPTNSV